MADQTITLNGRPEDFNYAELSKEFSTEELNAASWLALILLLAENRAYCDALRKVLIAKELVSEEDMHAALQTELEQPNLGHWYGFLNQLYAYRVAETLDLQKRARAGELPESQAPLGDLTEVSGDVPIPSGPPPEGTLTNTINISQVKPDDSKE